MVWTAARVVLRTNKAVYRHKEWLTSENVVDTNTLFNEVLEGRVPDARLTFGSMSLAAQVPIWRLQRTVREQLERGIRHSGLER